MFFLVQWFHNHACWVSTNFDCRVCLVNPHASFIGHDATATDMDHEVVAFVGNDPVTTEEPLWCWMTRHLISCTHCNFIKHVSACTADNVINGTECLSFRHPLNRTFGQQSLQWKSVSLLVPWLIFQPPFLDKSSNLAPAPAASTLVLQTTSRSILVASSAAPVIKDWGIAGHEHNGREPAAVASRWWYLFICSVWRRFLDSSWRKQVSNLLQHN